MPGETVCRICKGAVFWSKNANIVPSLAGWTKRGCAEHVSKNSEFRICSYYFVYCVFVALGFAFYCGFFFRFDAERFSASFFQICSFNVIDCFSLFD